MLALTFFVFFSYPKSWQKNRIVKIVLLIQHSLGSLALSDVVKGDADEIHTMVYDVFVKYFEENSEDFSTEAASELDKECDNVKFYVTDNTIVLYFDVYQVSSYAEGYPTVELQYSEGVFKIDLSENAAE